MADDVETLLAQRLADNDGWLIDSEDWEHAGTELRKDYLALARTTLTVTGGPTEEQRQVAALDAQVRELKRQRDRYKDAWHAACGRAVRLRNRKPR